MSIKYHENGKGYEYGADHKLTDNFYFVFYSERLSFPLPTGRTRTAIRKSALLWSLRIRRNKLRLR